MTTPAYQAPARFFTLPDGTPSTIQMKPGPDGQAVPVAVTTPQQYAEWQQIQAAAPPSPSQADAKLMASMARPLFQADAEADAMLTDLQLQAAMADGTAHTEELAPPKTPAENADRTAAAAALAASLDFALVWVPVTDAFGNPPHLELRQGDNPYAVGDLTSIERMLDSLARERALRNAKIRLWQDNRDRIERERQQAIYDLPESRLARLEARLAAAGIEV
jgi:hypothetical protein